jgi:hypothetical protein
MAREIAERDGLRGWELGGRSDGTGLGRLDERADA